MATTFTRLRRIDLGKLTFVHLDRPWFAYNQTLDYEQQCKRPGYVDVVECGADPTGRVDSSNAFNIAINSRPCFLLQAGKYKVSNDIASYLRSLVCIPQTSTFVKVKFEK